MSFFVRKNQHWIITRSIRLSRLWKWSSPAQQKKNRAASWCKYKRNRLTWPFREAMYGMTYWYFKMIRDSLLAPGCRDVSRPLCPPTPARPLMPIAASKIPRRCLSFSFSLFFPHSFNISLLSLHKAILGIRRGTDSHNMIGRVLVFDAFRVESRSRHNDYAEPGWRPKDTKELLEMQLPSGGRTDYASVWSLSLQWICLWCRTCHHKRASPLIDFPDDDGNWLRSKAWWVKDEKTSVQAASRSKNKGRRSQQWSSSELAIALRREC